MKWPRKNDADSIAARRDAIRDVVGDEPLAHDDEAWPRAQESHTGATVIPVSVVGPLVVELGEYELEEPAALRETGRAQEELLVPLAHTEGGLGLDVARDEGGGSLGRIPNIRASRQNDTCILLCLQDTADAVQLAKWLDDSLEELRGFLDALDDPSLSKRRSCAR